MILSTGYSKDEENSQVLKIAEHFSKQNKMKVVSKFLVGAFSQYYSCGYGLTCVDGNVVKNHGFVDKLTPKMLSSKFKQEDSIKKCHDAAEIINNQIKA